MAKYKVTLEIDVILPPSLIKDGVPDKNYLAKVGAFKISRAVDPSKLVVKYELVTGEKP